MRLGALVLAGGRGSRMGEGDPKPLRLLAGRPLIAHVTDRLKGLSPIVVNGLDDGSFDAFGDAVAPDLRPGFQGPLAGIEAGLDWIDAEHPEITHALIVPGDTPFLPSNLSERLRSRSSASQIVVAQHAGRLHPTVSLWPVALLSTLRDWLDDERPRALFAFLDHVGHRPISFDGEAPASDPFMNVNTPDDLARAERLLD